MAGTVRGHTNSSQPRAPYFLKVYGPPLGHRSQVEVADGSHMPGAVVSKEAVPHGQATSFRIQDVEPPG
jgi:hypothetical protein